MFRIENIKDNDDFVVFFKIIEKKYINNFLKEGQIYFGLLDDYRKMEGQGQQSVGDSYEASLTQKVQIYIGFNDSDFNVIINASFTPIGDGLLLSTASAKSIIMKRSDPLCP